MIESPETQPTAPAPGAAHEVYRRVRAVVAATGGRIAAFPPPAVLGTLALVQWAALGAVALRAAHDGWVYDAVGRPSSGVVSALPAIVIGQTLVLLPIALWLVYAVADRLAGRVFAAWAAVVWVLLPYAGYPFANRSFRHEYADQFLTHVVGLTGDPAFPAMVAFLASGYFALRARETGWVRAYAATLAAATAGAAFAPREALVAVAPAAVLAMGGRRTHVVAAAAGLALVLLIVGIASGTGLLSAPFAQFGLHAPEGALASLNENFWSGRILEWLTIAGILGALRRGRRAGVFAAVASLLAFLSIHAGGKTPAAGHLIMLHETLPAWSATVITIAAIPLLTPRGHAVRPARVTLAAILLRLEQPLNLSGFGIRRKPRAVDGAGVEDNRQAVAAPLWAVLTMSCLFVLIAFVGIWNAARYPITVGYDAPEHLAYADQLIQHGTIPSSTLGGEYYTPPGYYAVAGAVSWLGGELGMVDHHKDPQYPNQTAHYPHQAAQYLNVLFVLATAALLLVLARLLFPRRPVIWVASLGFFAFLPVVAKLAAMFQPETLNMLVSTGAVTLSVWMLVRRRFELRFFVLLGLLLGAGQLIRASSLFTFGAVAIAFLAALASSDLRRRLPLKKIGLAIVAVVLITSPWYARQILNFHKQGALLQPGSMQTIFHPHYAGTGPRPPFFGIALNDILNRPVRPFYVDQALSETYTDIWGDWTGNFAWSGYSAGPSPNALTVLKDQSKIGIVPTLLALAGWLGMVALLVARRLERIAFLPVVLLPVIAVGGYLLRSYDNLTVNGTLFKASYVLTTAPIWALAFGLAFSWFSRWRLLALALALVLVVSGVLELRFMLYGIRDHHVIF